MHTVNELLAELHEMRRRPGGGASSHAVLSSGQEALRLAHALAAGNNGPDTDQGLYIDGDRAIGAALGGTRVTVLLENARSAEVLHVWRQAAHRRLPIVINAITSTRGNAPSGDRFDSALSADAGAVVLHAGNVQDVFDLNLVARLAAENALLPVVVLIDGDATGTALQDVKLPAAAEVDTLLGTAEDKIVSPTAEQKLLFGPNRRRVPRWFDPDVPVLIAASQATDLGGHGESGRRPFVFDPFESVLAGAFEEVSRFFDRPVQAISIEKLKDAQLVIVARGAALEVAEAAATHLRSIKQKTGVAGIHAVRPFPGAQLADLLRGKQHVVVLEPSDSPLSQEPSLTQAIRGAAQRALELERHGDGSKGDRRGWRARDMPRIHSAIYGLGGLPLRQADLIELIRSIEKRGSGPFYLGIDFAADTGKYPKRQGRVDQVRKAFPGVEKTGITALDKSVTSRPDGSTVISILSLDGSGDRLATRAAELIHRARGGSVRYRAGSGRYEWAPYSLHTIAFGDETLRDPGDDRAADLLLVASPKGAAAGAVGNVIRGGAVLLPIGGALVDDILPLDRITAKISLDREVRFFRADTSGESRESREPFLLGALFSTLQMISRSIDTNRLTGALADLNRGLGDSLQTEMAEAFTRGLGSAQTVEKIVVERSPAPGPAPAPPWVRGLGREDNSFRSLPRFIDETMFRPSYAGEDEISPDPAHTLGVVPSMSAVFHDTSASRETMPAFDTALCTGCGNCWTFCPHGAITVAAQKPSAVLDHAMSEAKAAGRAVDSLRMIAAKLAPGMMKELAGEEAAPTVGAAIQEAFNKIIAKTKFQEDRRQSLEEAASAVAETVNILPAAVTEHLWTAPEASSKGTGNLLFLGIDPSACKGCGVCTSVCDPGALRLQPDSAERIIEARRKHDQVARVPETPTAVIAEIRKADEPGFVAATMLSRRYRHTMISGDHSTPGSGGAIALRHALASAAAVLGAARTEKIDRIADLQARFSEKIRETLYKALPTDQLDVMAEGIEAIGQSNFDLSSLAARIESASDAGTVDGLALQKLVDTARGLAETRWRLEKGIEGIPRAPFGLLLAGHRVAAWAGRFPDNPFSIPVSVVSAERAGSVARGLAESNRRIAAEEWRFVDEAAEIVKDPVRAARRGRSRGIRPAAPKPPPLPEVAPLLVLLDEEDLRNDGFDSLLALLGTDLPVKVVVLGAPAIDVDRAIPAASDLALLALAARRAFVLKTSIAHRDHFATGMADAVQFDGPALIHVHAPDPERHGFATDGAVKQAEIAVRTRSFPLFRYDPSDGGVFGVRVDLTGNPAEQESWVREESGDLMTPAHWAFTEARFAGGFRPFEQSDGEAIDLGEFIMLSNSDRAGKVPVLRLHDRSDLPTDTWHVPATVVDLADNRLQIWRTLQEIAGVVTPFTERVREEAESDIAARHKGEIASLKREYEAKIQAADEKARSEMLDRLRNRLVQLAGQTPAANDNGATS